MRIDRKLLLVILFPVAFIIVALPVAIWLGWDPGSMNERSHDDDKSAVAGVQAPVVLSSFAFTPSKLSVGAGDEVQFRAEGEAQHTVTVNGERQSGVMKAGDEFTWKVPAAGEYAITCDFHKEMTATITAR